MAHIVVAGAGAWGIALAMNASNAGCDVTLWARNEEAVQHMKHSRESHYLPGIHMPAAIAVSSDLQVVEKADAVMLVIPAQHMRAFCNRIKPYLLPKTPLIICSKGIEQETLMLMSEVVSSELPNPLAVLSGPNFADEVARGLPAATTLACEDAHLAQELSFLCQSAMFRPYSTTDIIGAQIGGAVKNVLAIASGITQGKGFGENAKAALLTRGVAEITRLCIAKGGKQETLMGLSGIGDIILTCGSIKSRNTSLGFALGQGNTLQAILMERKGVTEGVATAASVAALAEHMHVDMPICQTVSAILHQGKDIDKAIRDLLQRPLVPE